MVNGGTLDMLAFFGPQLGDEKSLRSSTIQAHIKMPSLTPFCVCSYLPAIGLLAIFLPPLETETRQRRRLATGGAQ